MPTYDYHCNHCDHDFELFQNISEPVKRKCPACGRLKLQRLIGAGAAIVFKGSGFYQTDYRSDSYRKAAEAEKKATSDASSSADKDKKQAGKQPSAPGAPKRSAATTES